jgi:predicted transcriptional regulator
VATGLISIKAHYAEAIYSGRKRAEFRKHSFPVDVERALLYVTLPTGLVTGEFSIREQVVAHPEVLWERFAKMAGIDEAGFFAYYEGRQRGVALVVRHVIQWKTPLTLNQIGVFNGAPMSMKTIEDVPPVR